MAWEARWGLKRMGATSSAFSWCRLNGVGGPLGIETPLRDSDYRYKDESKWRGRPVGGSEVFWEWNGRGHDSIWRYACDAAVPLLPRSPGPGLCLKRPVS